MVASYTGIPANVNPFSVNRDESISAGLLVGTSPTYFAFKDVNGRPYEIAPVDIQSSNLPYEAARDLVRRLFEADQPLNDTFAVKELYGHIIPEDLRPWIYVTRSNEETCSKVDCYHLE